MPDEKKETPPPEEKKEQPAPLAAQRRTVESIVPSTEMITIPIGSLRHHI